VPAAPPPRPVLAGGKRKTRVQHVISLALHYRLAPADAPEARKFARALAEETGLALQKGDMVSSHAVLADWTYRGAVWEEYLDYEDVGRGFRADNGFVGQNGYRRIYSETTRKFVGALGLNEITPYLNAEYKTDPSGNVLYQQNNLGLRFGLPRATTTGFEIRPNNLVAVREGGGVRKRDQFYFFVDSNPASWFSHLFSEVAIGDRVDVANNRVGKGYFYTVQASLKPHQRFELEYQISDDVIDSIEPVEGSKRILKQRVQQALGIWHFTSRDSVRTIWQLTSTRRAPSLWEQPVSAYDSNDTVSIVYGHRRGLGTNFYAGFNWSRVRDRDAGIRTYQTEFFVKGSWAFDVL